MLRLMEKESISEGGVCLILGWMEIYWQKGLWEKECIRGGKLKALDRR